jgi:hypothetical protein
MVQGVAENARLYKCDDDGYVWFRWEIPSLRLMRGKAFMRIQGASLQQLVGARYYVLSAATTPVYYPVQCLNSLVLVEGDHSVVGFDELEFLRRASGKAPLI